MAGSQQIKRIEQLLPVGEQVSKDFAKNITDEEFEVFNNVLKKMWENAEQK